MFKYLIMSICCLQMASSSMAGLVSRVHQLDPSLGRRQTADEVLTKDTSAGGRRSRLFSADEEGTLFLQPSALDAFSAKQVRSMVHSLCSNQECAHLLLGPQRSRHYGIWGWVGTAGSKQKDVCEDRSKPIVNSLRSAFYCSKTFPWWSIKPVFKISGECGNRGPDPCYGSQLHKAG